MGSSCECPCNQDCMNFETSSEIDFTKVREPEKQPKFHRKSVSELFNIDVESLIQQTTCYTTQSPQASFLGSLNLQEQTTTQTSKSLFNLETKRAPFVEEEQILEESKELKQPKELNHQKSIRDKPSQKAQRKGLLQLRQKIKHAKRQNNIRNSRIDQLQI